MTGLSLLPRNRLQPDTRHSYLISATEPVSRDRLEVFPDGGLGRLRVLGEITSAAMASLRERFGAYG